MRLYPVKRPLCVAISIFILGLCMGHLCPISLKLFIGLICGSAVIGVFLTRQSQRCRFSVYLLCFLLGFFLIQTQTIAHQALLSQHGAPATIQLTITNAPKNRLFIDGQVLAIDEHPLKHAVPVRLKRSYGDTTTYLPYATYAFKGTFAAPQPQTSPGGFNEEKMLAQRGIFTLFAAKDVGKVIAPMPFWREKLYALKRNSFAILEHALTQEECALIWATLFGDVSLLNEDFYTLSQQYGIIHIFSVSGLHVGFIIAFVLLLAKALRRQHTWGLLVLFIILLGLYTLLSDASAPAVRASLMAIIALFALRLHRYHDPLTIIALAALFLLLANPYNLWQIGFQLSFIAMLGIILLTGPFTQLLTFLPAPLAKPLAVTLAAEAITLPLVAYYFYMVAPLSLVMNLCIVPLFSALVPLALLALLLSGLCMPLAPLFFLPTKILIHAIVAIMSAVTATIGPLHRYIGQPPWWMLLGYGMTILLFFFAAKKHKEKPAMGLLLLSLLLLCVSSGAAKDLRLSVVDVGQGSGATYQTAQGEWLVFDTGPSMDTLAQYLRYCGVNHLSAIVISHSDSDHIHGTAHLLRDFKVDHLIASEKAQKSSEWQALLPYLKSTTIQTIEKENSYTLHPTTTLDLALIHSTEQLENNSHQVVAYLREKEHRYLFPGDTAGPFLQDFPWDAPLDVVLVPHHGSKNSWQEGFYRRYQPRLAVISCGRANRFGHPHQEVIEGLQGLNIPTYSTHQSGTIEIYQTAQGLKVKPFLS